jgi:hypothetical protein
LRALQANAHQIGGVLKAHIGISYERISSIRDLNPVALAALESSEEVKSIQEAWNIHQLAIELHKEYAKLNSFENSEAEDLLSRTEYLYMKVNQSLTTRFKKGILTILCFLSLSVLPTSTFPKQQVPMIYASCVQECCYPLYPQSTISKD